jgi:hypothetical protein
MSSLFIDFARLTLARTHPKLGATDYVRVLELKEPHGVLPIVKVILEAISWFKSLASMSFKKPRTHFPDVAAATWNFPHKIVLERTRAGRNRVQCSSSLKERTS